MGHIILLGLVFLCMFAAFCVPIAYYLGRSLPPQQQQPDVEFMTGVMKLDFDHLHQMVDLNTQRSEANREQLYEIQQILEKQDAYLAACLSHFNKLRTCQCQAET